MHLQIDSDATAALAIEAKGTVVINALRLNVLIILYLLCIGTYFLEVW